MKIRTDFVTNSSSSSFVIAQRNDCTKEDLRQIVMQYEEQIKEAMLDYDEDVDSYDQVINDIVDSLNISTEYGLKLNNWTIEANRYSSEDEVWEYVIYQCFNDINDEKFKMRCTD